MNIIKQTTFSKLLVGICLLCILTIGVFPVFIGNYSEYAFDPDSVAASSTLCPQSYPPHNQEIERLVALSSVFFLRAESRYLELLQLIEAYNVANSISNTNPKEGSTPSNCLPKIPRPGTICEAIRCVIVNLNYTITTYNELINYAKFLEKSDHVILILHCFKYNEFLDVIPGSTGLDHSIISGLLREGDVVGVYQKLKTDCETLLAKMVAMESFFGCQCDLDLQILANNEDNAITQCWGITRDFANIHLFGEHVSRIFFYIKNNIDQSSTTYWNLNNCNVSFPNT